MENIMNNEEKDVIIGDLVRAKRVLVGNKV